MRMSRTILANAVAAVPMLMINMPGYAADEKPALEEILVTAQLRDETLQDIPIAVTAITASDIDDKHLINMQDIKKLVPNLYIEEALSSVTTPKAWIRGLGVDNQVFSFDSPIGFYVDNVYYARVTGAMGDLFDLERVEVLRGPQGTIFGRNSSVGAIRLITKTPNLESKEFMLEASMGSKSQRNGRFLVNVPLSSNKLGLRIAASTRNNDGWMRNLTSGQRHMTEDVNAIRGSLRYVPSESFTATLRADYMSDESVTRPGSNFLINPDNDIYTFEAAPEQWVDEIRPWGTSATFEWAADGFDVTSITAYRDLKYRNAGDVDGRADVRSFEVDQQDLDQWQFTQEIFLTGEGIGSIDANWVAGAFFLTEDNSFDWALRIFAPPTRQHFEQETNSYAAYLQATVPVADRWSLTAGARYTDEEKKLVATQFLPDGAQNPDFLFKDSIGAQKVTWRLAADYQAADGVMLFASASTGFRSAGFNGSARDVPSIESGAFDTEDSFSIEGGAKTQWFDNRLTLNATYFWAEYEGLQQAILQNDGTINTSNVQAEIHGLEAELTAAVTDGLRVNLALGTLNDKILNSPLELKNTPDVTVRGGFTYSMTLAGAGEIRLGADANFTADSFNATENTPGTETGDYTIVDAYVTYISEDGHWNVSLSGFNLTDEFVNIHTFNIAGGVISSVHFPNHPRRWLATVRYTF